jgi:hypothetical protein
LSQADAQVIAQVEPGPIKTNPSDCAEDFIAKHSSSSDSLASNDHLTSSSRTQTPTPAQKRAGMKLHCVFLRSSCILPNYLDPLRGPFGESWTHVEEISAPVFDTMIRHAGWHFIFVHGTRSRRGFGVTRDDATHRAVIRALGEVSGECNAAELDSVQVAKYPGFHVARVTVQPRQVQQHTSLGIADKKHPEAVPAR